MDLKTPIRNAGGVYKRYANALEKLGIVTFEDFLFHFPSRYEDYTLISKIAQVQAGEVVTIQGNVTYIKNQYTRSRITIQKAKVADETGEIDIVWFNQTYLTRAIHEGDMISLSGKVDMQRFTLVMQSPDYEILTPDAQALHTGRLVPIYPETRGISSKWLRRQIYKILSEQKQNLIDYLPEEIITKHDFMGFTDALEQIHFPNSQEKALHARNRLAFDELFLLQQKALHRKADWQKNYIAAPFALKPHLQKIEEFLHSLPFELTNAQKKAVDHILSDITSEHAMNRLLEGDVGSGKTVVATIAMYLAFLNGFQSVLMAPTEILAQQHFATVTNLLSKFGVKVGLATGSKKLMANNTWQMDKKLSAISNKPYAGDILIGTHAVLQKTIAFDNLGLVIIDEQQRFGVEQRAVIRAKGKNPHLLTMTATPIPRTVALTMYGDLDLSYLDEMPKGRRLIKTWLVPSEKRLNAYEWIRKQIKETQSQAFIICPFIEESESMQTVKAATKEYEHLKTDIFPDLNLGLLHGRLKAKEKDTILSEFRTGKFDILVATPVVEVGIDIPNATIMVIEAADRFGLSQLHQLRGRVGRGEKQSYCLLFTQTENQQSAQRLKAMETMHVGAKLAELDMHIRGSGDIYGVMQHGKKLLKIADFSDATLIEKAKEEAKNIFPQIKNYPLLAQKIKEAEDKKVSPD
ncbi:MAG TPA: ATP-dependent DNA helicase RecG [Candidatus Saccharimonadales bacterium]|nr:ATP-dependent DNA helicase RecG [Candidatus Saccharimonadales bacterium]